jgi:hypothetical protein
MADQPDQKTIGTALAFQEELNQAIEIWNQAPVSILDRQAVHTHALLLSNGEVHYLSERKRES